MVRNANCPSGRTHGSYAEVHKTAPACSDVSRHSNDEQSSAQYHKVV